MILFTFVCYILFKKKPEIKFSICNHGFDVAEDLRSAEPQALISNHRKTSQETTNGKNKLSQESAPIRIVFNITHIDQKDITKEEISAINETLYNCAKYLSDRVNVTNTTINGISGSVSDGAGSSSYSVSCENCDLLIAVFLKEKEKPDFSVLARAGATDYCEANTSNNKDRPCIGRITIFQENLKITKPQDQYSSIRNGFLTLLHEINHILSFSDNLFSKWPNNISVTQNTFKQGYPLQYYLSPEKAPHLHNWTVDRFTLNGKKPILANGSAFQLEDGGGDGTKISHPNERLFFTDIMQGVNFGPSYISELYFFGLEDSGWYSADFGNLETLVYLNSELDKTLDFTDEIIVGPPKLSFPTSYLCSTYDEVSCFYDNVYIGICKTNSSFARINEIERYNQYYNPDGDNLYYGEGQVLDYVPIKVPWLSCRDPSTYDERAKSIFSLLGKGQPEDYGEKFINSSRCMSSSLYKNIFGSIVYNFRCFETFCSGDDLLRVVVGNHSRICRHKGDRIYFEGYSGTIICPDPKVSCANLPITEQFTYDYIAPDRGPLNGGNFVRFHGKNYDLYESIEIQIEDIRLEIIEKNSTSVLTRVPILTKEQMKGKTKRRYPLIVNMKRQSSNKTIYTKVDDAYLFHNYEYQYEK